MLKLISGTPQIISKQITIENTSFCGASCTMCPRDEYKNRHRLLHMQNDLYKKVVKEASTLGINYITLTGFGDPLLDPRFEDKLLYLKTHHPHIKTYISTTGHLLNKQTADVVAENIDILKISNYGITKESYESIHRGALKFEDVMSNLNSFINRKKRPYIHISFLIMPENQDEVEEWKNYWEPKVDEISIWAPHNWAGSYEPTNNVTLNNGYKPCQRVYKGNPYIRANGDVSICCFDYNHDLIIGNIMQSSLQSILQSSKYQEIKEIHDQLSFDNSDIICKNCDQIKDRSESLIYASNKRRKVGTKNSEAIWPLLT